MELASPRLSGVFGAIALAGGGITLAGHLLGIPGLTDWSGGGIAMKPNTAIVLMSAGAGLLTLALARGSMWGRVIAGIFGGLSAAVGGLTLLEHLTGWNFGIDTLLFDEAPGLPATASPGRMGPPASAAMLLAGCGLLIAAATRSRAPDSERRFSARSLTPVCGILTCSIALLAICGYLFRAEKLYTVPGLTGIAFQTAGLILAAGLG